jgi:sugar transferase (PEP-CTERM/EpsH1 system associated)
MKILCVSHRLPFPPGDGGRTRPFHVIRHLHEAGHEVTVASIVRTREEERAAAGIAEHCTRHLLERVSSSSSFARVAARLPGPLPSSMGYWYGPRLARRIRDLTDSESFDLAFVHSSAAAQYVLHLEGLPKILDFGHLDSQEWLVRARTRSFPLAICYRAEGRRLERAEAALARRFDLCTCATRAGLATLGRYATGAAAGWFPDGVDGEYFSPAGTPYEPDTICFAGRMDHWASQEAMLRFCREVLPLLRVHRPGLRLDIVGARPNAAIRRLGELPGVRVTGSVPDVRPFVRAAALTVAPLASARGTAGTVLESLAMGVPVVSSSSAAAGVDAVPGEHLLVADEPGESRDAILALLENPALRERFARAGRERVVSHHGWDGSLRMLDDLVERRLGGTRMRPAGVRVAAVSGA